MPSEKTVFVAARSISPPNAERNAEGQRSVNQDIVPERNERELAGEGQLIDQIRADYNDCAVSKRELLQRSCCRCALFAERGRDQFKENTHLVLVVRTRSGDLVLDNLTAQIKPGRVRLR